MDLKQQEPVERDNGMEQQGENAEEKSIAKEERPASQPTEPVIGEDEDFDPETADRGALRERYRALEVKLSEAQANVLRIAADAENFKKRLEREKEERTRYANEALMRELLVIVDNLERAIDHSQAGTKEGLVEGLNMTLKGFSDTLARFGCTPVEAVGKAFDPNFHEAVSQEESAEHQANTVVRELQRGYVLKERLLRPAMVIVSRSPKTAVDTASDEDETEEQEKSATVKVRVSPK